MWRSYFGGSFAGVQAGLFIISSAHLLLIHLRGPDPNVVPGLGFAAFAVALGMVSGLAAGYVAGWLAGHRPILHAGILAGILSLVTRANGEMVLPERSVFALIVPSVLAGGLLCRKSTQ